MKSPEPQPIQQEWKLPHRPPDATTLTDSADDAPVVPTVKAWACSVAQDWRWSTPWRRFLVRNDSRPSGLTGPGKRDPSIGSLIFTLHTLSVVAHLPRAVRPADQAQ
ncbi:MAG: hypothetical protein OXN89_22530 [Bryobacterales bacterium]|nr:hypothetical protein [Bryobacterales bacterium]